MNILKTKGTELHDTLSKVKNMTNMATMKEFPHTTEALQLYKLYTGNDYIFTYDESTKEGVLWVPAIQKHPQVLPYWDYYCTGAGNLDYLEYNFGCKMIEVAPDHEKMTQKIVDIVTTTLKAVE